MKKNNNNNFQSSIASAALQDYLSRNLGIIGQGTARKKIDNLKQKENSERIKNKVEVVLNPRDDYLKTISWAERNGLVKSSSKIVPSLNESSWKYVKQLAINRLDHLRSCPICHEKFGLEITTILDCSHLFHKNCLESFEKFSKLIKCPICRHENYEKRVVFFAEDAYIDCMAIIIQSAWRGKMARRKIQEIRLEVSKKSSNLDSKVTEVRLAKNLVYLATKTSTSLQEQQKKHEEDVAEFIDDLDTALKESREVMQKLEDRLKIKKGDRFNSRSWYDAWQSHLSRDTRDCPICLLEWSNAKPRVLLSCSHVFHVSCLSELEKHLDSIGSRTAVLINPEGKACPICRWPNYEKCHVPGLDRLQCLNQKLM